MVAGQPSRSEPKGRPPLRNVPDDFDVIFVETGRQGCESWYRAHKRTVTRWLIERGKARLIKARAAFVKHQRSQGKWLTRSTCMVQHRATGLAACAQPVTDRRMVSGTLARHAAQYLRIHRHGGFIVSPSSNGDWRVGTRSLSAAQLVDFACTKGFDRSTPLPDAVEAQQEFNSGRVNTTNIRMNESRSEYGRRLQLERRGGVGWFDAEATEAAALRPKGTRR